MSLETKPLFLSVWKPFPKDPKNPTQNLEPYQITALIEKALKDPTGEANWYSSDSQENHLQPRIETQTSASNGQEASDLKRRRETEVDGQEGESSGSHSKKTKTAPANADTAQVCPEEIPPLNGDF